jgi:hypothetical protein
MQSYDLIGRFGVNLETVGGDLHECRDINSFPHGDSVLFSSLCHEFVVLYNYRLIALCYYTL